MACDFCPDDDSLIDTWKETIRGLECRIKSTKDSTRELERELIATRKHFRKKLRKGELR